jgi:putative membrane protein
LLFQLLRIVRQLLLPALAALVFSRGNYPFWMVVFIVPAAVGTLVSYLNYTYRFEDDGLVVRKGIVTRNERHVPYARIQNVNLVQGPLHRLLGVAEVRLETAGGTEPEAVMRVLSLDAVETLRSGIAAGRGAAGREDNATGHEAAAPDVAPEVAEETRTLVRLDTRDLVRFGVISNRGLVLVAAALGVLMQSDLIDHEKMVETAKAVLTQLTGNIALPGPLVSAVLVAATVIVLLILLQALSIVWAILRFHGFTLRRRGEDLHAEHGLFTRVSATIPTRRIQLLSVRQGPLHRLFRSATVRVDTAGGRAEQGGESSGQLWLAPILPSERVGWLIGEALPGVSADDLSWSPLAPRARRRVVFRGLAVVTVLSVGAVAGAGLWGLLLPMMGVPLALIHAALFVRHTGWTILNGAVFFRSGWWVRRTSVVRFSKTQVVTVRESPFDRRRDMATVEVDTAGAGRIGHRVRIPYLEAAVARTAADRVGHEAAATVFNW